LDRKRRKRFADPETQKVSDDQSDESAEETKRGRFNQELKQNRAAARTERLARSNFFGPLFHTDKRDVHDADSADEKRKAGNEPSSNRNGVFHGIERALERLLLVDREIVLLFRLEAAHAPHDPDQLVLGLGELLFVFHFNAHVGFGVRA